MKILPTLAEVREIASDVNYNVLPVSCEILSDFTTPIEIIKILKNVSTHCYMLESAQANETWGRYTFLGFDPKMEITCVDGEMKIGNLKLKTEHPSDYLRQILADYKSPRFDYLPPFTGGLVGYFSYDYLGYSEPTVKCDAKDTEDFKDVDLMLFDKVIAFDHLRQKIVLIVNMLLDDVEVRYNKAVMELKRLIELLRNGEKRGSQAENFWERLHRCLAKNSSVPWWKRQNTIFMRETSFKLCCQTDCLLPLKEACSIPTVFSERSIRLLICSIFQERMSRLQALRLRPW